jgi:RNA 2',3'-cyclic 3'-phosphodiesterase
VRVEGYEEVWQRFVAGRRLEFGGHMDPEWQDGHAFSASLMVPVDASRLRERLEPLRDALRPFPFVSLHPDHFMHLTVALLGFVVDEPAEENEVSRERLAGIERDARRVLAGFPAFGAGLANLNAFPGAAFVEVHDGGRLERLRDVLSEGCGIRKPSGPPHLTVAYFHAPNGARAPEELVRKIGEYRNWQVGEVEVRSVEMSSLDLRSDYPEPNILAKMPLAGTGQRVG